MFCVYGMEDNWIDVAKKQVSRWQELSNRMLLSVGTY